MNSYVYDPFGKITDRQEAMQQPFTFVGQYGVMTEPDGLYYMRARYYDPNAGRFISEDPLGLAGGDVNLYAYAGNNPVMMIDPWGRCGENSQKSFLEYASDFAAGFGDTITFGGTRWIRQQMGTDFMVNSASSTYTSGKWAGYAWDVVIGTTALARTAGYELVFRTYPNAGGAGMTLLKDGGRVISVDWHKFMVKGEEMFRPHMDIPGIVKHWPWR